MGKLMHERTHLLRCCCRPASPFMSPTASMNSDLSGGYPDALANITEWAILYQTRG